MFTVQSIVRNLDLEYDGTFGGDPDDTSPADNKLLEVTISCDNCKDLQPITLTGQIAPRALESTSNNGSLLIHVFDANGQPVQGASVHVVNVATTTSIVLDDVTDASGVLQLFDVPTDSNAYRITVSKTGYSTDRTYPVGGAGNPSPSKADATVIALQVTQVSFSIDEVGRLNISSVGPTCSSVANFDFNLTGSKQIGLNVPKYSVAASTDALGIKNLTNMEWDEYSFTPTDASYSLAGFIPLNPAVLNPAATTDVKLVAIPNAPRMLLVTVKDLSDNLPLSSTTVTVSTTTGYTATQTTGKGTINQSDWSGGSGQTDYSATNRYSTDDGNIDVSQAGEIKLRSAFGTYNPNGMLESSTFDTGSASNFYALSWSPVDPPPATGASSVRLQIATSASSTGPWSFKGPDGTGVTYYTVPNSALNAIHNGKRYFRYRLYLSTLDTTVSPNISDISFTYASLCTPPGQVIFSGLASSTYTVTVSKQGYASVNSDVSTGSNWQELKVTLSR